MLAVGTTVINEGPGWLVVLGVALLTASAAIAAAAIAAKTAGMRQQAQLDHDRDLQLLATAAERQATDMAILRALLGDMLEDAESRRRAMFTVVEEFGRVATRGGGIEAATAALDRLKQRQAEGVGIYPRLVVHLGVDHPVVLARDGVVTVNDDFVSMANYCLDSGQITNADAIRLKDQLRVLGRSHGLLTVAAFEVAKLDLPSCAPAASTSVDRVAPSGLDDERESQPARQGRDSGGA